MHFKKKSTEELKLFYCLFFAQRSESFLFPSRGILCGFAVRKGLCVVLPCVLERWRACQVDGQVR